MDFGSSMPKPFATRSFNCLVSSASGWMAYNCSQRKSKHWNRSSNHYVSQSFLISLSMHKKARSAYSVRGLCY